MSFLMVVGIILGISVAVGAFTYIDDAYADFTDVLVANGTAAFAAACGVAIIYSIMTFIAVISVVSTEDAIGTSATKAPAAVEKVIKVEEARAIPTSTPAFEFGGSGDFGNQVAPENVFGGEKE